MAKLISKKYITDDTANVYDIEVADTHNYFANGLLVHNCSPSSKQGQQLLQLKKNIKVPVEWIPMTGTPIVNKATDVFTPLKLVDGHTFKNYHEWCQHFCVYGGFGNHNIIAYKNIPELKQLLQSNMLRRLKKDVLDLPPKIRITEFVENTEYQNKNAPCSIIPNR